MVTYHAACKKSFGVHLRPVPSQSYTNGHVATLRIALETKNIGQPQHLFLYLEYRPRHKKNSKLSTQSPAQRTAAASAMQHDVPPTWLHTAPSYRRCSPGLRAIPYTPCYPPERSFPNLSCGAKALRELERYQRDAEHPPPPRFFGGVEKAKAAMYRRQACPSLF